MYYSVDTNNTYMYNACTLLTGVCVLCVCVCVNYFKAGRLRG